MSHFLENQRGKLVFAKPQSRDKLDQGFKTSVDDLKPQSGCNSTLELK